MDGLLVVSQHPAEIQPRQGLAAEGLFHVAELGLLGAQELAARRRIEEQVAHRHRGTARVRRGRDPRLHAAPFHHHTPAAGRVVLDVGHQLQARHRTDRASASPRKPGSPHPRVVQRRNLAGGMTRQGQRQIFLVDADAIITHPDQACPTRLQLHLDAPATGIDGILDQLLDHRGGSLDHFTCGDLVGQSRIENRICCLSVITPPDAGSRTLDVPSIAMKRFQRKAPLVKLPA